MRASPERAAAREDHASHALLRGDPDAAHDAHAGDARRLDGRDEARVHLAAREAVRAGGRDVRDPVRALDGAAQKAPGQRPGVDEVDQRNPERGGHEAPSRKYTTTAHPGRSRRQWGMPPDGLPLTVSVVMPCLNEAETVARCVAEALAALRAARDSTARSSWPTTARRTARASSPGAPARASSLSRTRGYGAALAGGIRRRPRPLRRDGRRRLSLRLRRRTGLRRRRSTRAPTSSWARGSAARIETGAMPPLHRWLGNPVLTGLGRLFFRTDVSDFHCGLRAFRRDALSSGSISGRPGWSTRARWSSRRRSSGSWIREIPVTLRKDGRSRPPHLRTWRDGWRHLRFLLLYSPRWLFLVPGLTLALAGSALILWLLPGPRSRSARHARRPHDARRRRDGPRRRGRHLLRGVREDLRHHRRPPPEGPPSRPPFRPLGHARDRSRSPGRRASSEAAFSWAAS